MPYPTKTISASSIFADGFWTPEKATKFSPGVPSALPRSERKSAGPGKLALRPTRGTFWIQPPSGAPGFNPIASICDWM